MLRDVEEMSTTDTANILEITEENVKVRLHRARALLRKGLYARAGIERKEVFNFHAVRCDRVVKNVFERIQKQSLKRKDSEATYSDSLHGASGPTALIRIVSIDHKPRRSQIEVVGDSSGLLLDEEKNEMKE